MSLPFRRPRSSYNRYASSRILASCASACESGVFSFDTEAAGVGDCATGSASLRSANRDSVFVSFIDVPLGLEHSQTHKSSCVFERQPQMRLPREYVA